tara:strand:+ start:89 stop:1075 length:987 start_codon:yes stop_codon:yes gene_type:complete
MYKYKLKENSEFEVGDVKVKDGTQSTITDINPVTGAVSWDVKKVGAFDTVYKTFDKLNKLLRTLESEGEAESDSTIDSITDQVKKLFNQYRTHVRKNYPEAYDRIRMVKESEQWTQLDVNNVKRPLNLTLKTLNNLINNIGRLEAELSKHQNKPQGNILYSITPAEFDYSNLKNKLVKLSKAFNSLFGSALEEELSIKEEEVDEGEGMGYLTPKAFDKNKSSTGAKDIYYYKLGFKPVPKKIKGSGLEVKQLFEKEELTEYSDFQQKRINIFDDVEEKINSISPLLSNAKNETAQYYNENPGSYTIVYSTDMVNELLDDITKLLKQGE